MDIEKVEDTQARSDEIAFRGWSRQWIDLALKFEQTEIIETDYGYRICKLRYEIVPGFMSTALPYEPDKITGDVPAIVNFIGHGPST